MTSGPVHFGHRRDHPPPSLPDSTSPRRSSSAEDKGPRRCRRLKDTVVAGGVAGCDGTTVSTRPGSRGRRDTFRPLVTGDTRFTLLPSRPNWATDRVPSRTVPIRPTVLVAAVRGTPRQSTPGPGRRDVRVENLSNVRHNPDRIRPESGIPPSGPYDPGLPGPRRWGRETGSPGQRVSAREDEEEWHVARPRCVYGPRPSRAEESRLVGPPRRCPDVARVTVGRWRAGPVSVSTGTAEAVVGEGVAVRVLPPAPGVADGLEAVVLGSDPPAEGPVVPRPS